MRLVIAAIAVAAVLFSATCGGHVRNGAHNPSITHDTPLLSKTASIVPADVRLVARDAVIALSAGGYTLSWKYENPGDYGQDGKAGVEDVTPIAQHFGEAVSPENEWIKVNGTSAIGVSEITPIAMNWASEVTGYRIDGTNSISGQWNEIASFTIADGDKANGRLAFAHEIATGYTYYRVVTLTPDGDAAFTQPLVAPSNEPIIYGVTPTSGYQYEEYTFTATVSGQEPLTYAWEFGSGATPNTSSDISPTVMLSDAGEYSATLTISNSYGPTTFPFTLTISARDMWVHTWKGLGWSDGWGLLTDDSNLYVVGGDNEDALLLKYSQGGDIIWAREYGVNGLEGALGCLFDSEGNILAAGQSYALGEGSFDLMLLKYSPDGELLRAMTWGTSDYECIVSGFCQDDFGNIYICGKWFVYGGNPRVLVVKLDAGWNVLWAKLWGGTGSNRPLGIAISGDSLYVCGDTNSFGAPEYDAFILKMDESGNPLWARTWGTERSDAFFDIAVGSDGSVYAVGNSSVWGESSSSVFTKFSTEGTLELMRGWNIEINNQVNAIGISTIGKIAVCGEDGEYGLIVLTLNNELDYEQGKAWVSYHGGPLNRCAFDGSGNLFLTGQVQTFSGSWTEELPDLTYNLEGSTGEVTGSLGDIQGISNDVSGVESIPAGIVDGDGDHQLLIMKNYPP